MNDAEYCSHNNHIRGICKPISESPDCSQYLGIHVAERVLSHVFEEVHRMPITNPGYDFVCKKGYKIDVKSACLYTQSASHASRWGFHIFKNKIADYFLCMGFDDRTSLTPMMIWLFKNNEIINNVVLNEKVGFGISNTDSGLVKFKQYELIDKLEAVLSCCDIIRSTKD